MAYTNIDDPSAHFQTALWAGNSSTQTIINDGNSDLQPDWVWLKSRTTTNVHLSQDSTIGATGGVYRYLQPDNTAAEAVQTDGDGITSLNSNGFSLGYGNSNSWNSTGKNYVAWQWKANGGTTSSNTDGTLTGGATVQANTDAGFSIITYTGTSQTYPTVGHGLNQAPEIVIVKNRDLVRNWAVGATAVGWTDYLRLDTNNAAVDNIGYWGDQDPTSTTVGIGTISNTAGNTYDYVMYAFHSVQGFSKIGKYVGNGNVDGTFVYTGFKPAFIMCKRTDGTGNAWDMHDSARDPFNPSGTTFYADTAGAELTGNNVDLLSNGFKQRDTSGNRNGNGNTYIYMAFAENPFTTSTGIPTTAR